MILVFETNRAYFILVTFLYKSSSSGPLQLYTNFHKSFVKIRVFVAKKIFLFQYKHPNIQSGILFPKPISMSSIAK